MTQFSADNNNVQLIGLELLEKIVNNEGSVTVGESIKFPGSNLNFISEGGQVTSSNIGIIVNKLRNNGFHEIKIKQCEATLKYEYDFDIISTVDSSISRKTKLAVGSLISNQQFNYEKVSDVIDSVKEIIEVLHNKKGSFKYSLKQYQDETTLTDQAVRIAIFATVIANQYNKTATQKVPLDKIAMAALLMNSGEIYKDSDVRKNVDFGVLKTIFRHLNDKSIYDPTKTVADDLVDNYREDYLPIYSFYALCQNKDVTDADTRNMILFGRENMASTGVLHYPLDALQPARIGAQILSLCHIFDASITSNIEYQETLESTLSLIQATQMGNYYKPDLVKHLLCSVSLYPVRTKVKVSVQGREEYAIVIDDHKERISELFKIYERTLSPGVYSEICRIYSRPVVELIMTGEEIDLTEKTSVTITSVIGDTVNYSELKEQALETTRRTR